MKKLLVIVAFLGILTSSFAYHYSNEKVDNVETLILQTNVDNFSDDELAHFMKNFFKGMNVDLK